MVLDVRLEASIYEQFLLLIWKSMVGLICINGIDLCQRQTSLQCKLSMSWLHI